MGGPKIINEGYAKPERVTYASGCHFGVSGGQRYLDTSMGSGVAILGHGRHEITRAIYDAAQWGTVYGRPALVADEYARLLGVVLPQFDRFVLCNTGSEAVARLARLARARARKPRVALFSGGWHGSLDTLLVDEGFDGQPCLRSLGTPEEVLSRQTLLLPYGRWDECLDLIRRHRDELALVVVEPVQGSLPRHDVGDFLSQLRAVTSEIGVLLAFDEILTGARLGLGGASAWFGVQPDLAVYGKIFGGGLPIGIVAGTSGIMDWIKEPAVRGQPVKGTVILGGTFTGNPVSLAAGAAMLKLLSSPYGVDVYNQISINSAWLRGAVNQLCSWNGIPARMYGVGSISRLVLSGVGVGSASERDVVEAPQSVQRAFYDLVFARGVSVAANRLIFLSSEHSDRDIVEVYNVLADALTETFLKGDAMLETADV